MKELKTLPFQVNQKIVDILTTVDELKKRQKEEYKAAHKQLWDTVHSEYPELDTEANYQLKAEYLEQGIVMLDTQKCTHDKLNELLGKVLKDVN